MDTQESFVQLMASNMKTISLLFRMAGIALAKLVARPSSLTSSWRVRSASGEMTSSNADAVYKVLNVRKLWTLPASANVSVTTDGIMLQIPTYSLMQRHRRIQSTSMTLKMISPIMFSAPSTFRT